MAYTCPDCLAISQLPEDEKHSYCGRCKEFKDKRLDHPSAVQHALITAMMAPDPGPAMISVIIEHRAKDSTLTWDTIKATFWPITQAQRVDITRRYASWQVYNRISDNAWRHPHE